MFVKPEVRKSLLAKMLNELLDTRVMVKSSMKSVADDRVCFLRRPRVRFNLITVYFAGPYQTTQCSSTRTQVSCERALFFFLLRPRLNLARTGHVRLHLSHVQWSDALR
jgi:hypothetical protein